jgi:hypothetical protein
VNANSTNQTDILDEFEHYAAAHPGSPAAIRRPRIFRRSETWVALLGDSIEDGIVGYGDTIESALRVFDVRYLALLRPASETANAGEAA